MKTLKTKMGEIKIWEPSLLQRLMYWIGLMKDPRYSGDKVDWRKHDECGLMEYPMYDAEKKDVGRQDECGLTMEAN